MTFKEKFKYYKSRNTPPDLKDVIDLDDPQNNRVTSRKRLNINETCEAKLGLKPVRDWEIYELVDIPGLIFVKNPFTAGGQQYWIIKCLKDYARKPNRLNIDAHDFLKDNESWWDICFENSDRARNLLPKLRWATLGYHHNWDTKMYSEEFKTEIPADLSELIEFIAEALGFLQFQAEAAIINYYRMNSTLAGHTDHSEINVDAPLFSVSFGQSAVFLIGGQAQEDPASALFLKSGDIIVMSGESRLRYHGVPKILPAVEQPWDNNESDNEQHYLWNVDDWNKAKIYISEARINMNVRQVLQLGQTSLY